jgi:DNA-binding NarL/FixJ family response regulator
MKRLRPLMGTRRREQIDRALASYAPDPRRLLNEARAAQALRMLATGESVKQVAKKLGTSIWCIYDLRLGRTHRHLSRAV